MILPVITLAGFFLSCNIINPPEDIPSYIKVDSLFVKVTNFEQGSASHNLTVMKINVGGTTLGYFEMPALVPCLATGPQSLYLEPVYQVNGINGTREVYPFFKPYIGTGKFDLKEGEVINVVPTTTYKPECVFAWMEDFEDAGVSFIYSNYSDTVFMMENDTVKEGRYSGAIHLDKKNNFFWAYSGAEFALPTDGSKSLLEIDYRGTTTFEFGVYVITNESTLWNELVYIRPSTKWSRIYLDLSNIAGNNQTATGFIPGFRASWDSTGPARQTIFMDNLKLIHF